jgi:hypothetical protein
MNEIINQLSASGSTLSLPRMTATLIVAFLLGYLAWVGLFGPL